MPSTELSKTCWRYCRILYLPEELTLPISTAEVLEVNLEILKKKDIKNQASGDEVHSLSEVCWVYVLTSTSSLNILLLSLSSERNKSVTSCFCQFCKSLRHNQVTDITGVLLMGWG